MEIKLRSLRGNYPAGIPHLKEYLEMGYSQEALAKHRDALELHIRAVQAAGLELGVTEHQLQQHDFSKFSREEFGPYARHFHGGGAPGEFARAWLHHIHNNPHHWQYWMFPDGFAMKDSQSEGGVMPMPDMYILEMLADWLGASYTYTNSWDLSGWLKSHMRKITLHTQTASYLRGFLAGIGYDLVYDERFAHELKREDSVA